MIRTDIFIEKNPATGLQCRTNRLANLFKLLDVVQGPVKPNGIVDSVAKRRALNILDNVINIASTNRICLSTGNVNGPFAISIASK